MKKHQKKGHTNHKLLLITLAISIGLLLLFLLFQYLDFKILKLDSKWMLLAGIPLLLGLLVGGYIKSIEVFGAELQFDLEKSIPPDIYMKKGIGFIESPGIEKRERKDLRPLSPSEKDSYIRLKMIFGRKGYYSEYAIQDYFEQLPKLKYIEVVDNNGAFMFLYEASKIKIHHSRHEVDIIKTKQLITAIEDEDKGFFNGAVSEYIEETDNILEAYRKIKKSRNPIMINKNIKSIELPVVDKKKRMIGLIELQSLESQIAEIVDNNYD